MREEFGSENFNFSKNRNDQKVGVLTSWYATIREANQGIERGMLIEVGRDARLRELVKGGSHFQDPKFCSTKYGKLLSLRQKITMYAQGKQKICSLTRLLSV